MKIVAYGLAAAVLMGSAFGAFAQGATGDAAAGKKVFRKCAACHFHNKEKKKTGPHLIEIVGRAIGSVENFKYSKSFNKIAERNLVWDEALLDEYLTDPAAFTKKYGKGRGNMVLKLKTAQNRADVIAFLKEEAKIQ